MQITVTGTPKEIAALVLEIQERQLGGSDVANSVVNLLQTRSTQTEPVFQP